MKPAKLRHQIDKVLAPVPIDFGGGCSAAKATVFAHLILSEKIERSIDLGVYRGRSYFPQAWAHRHKGHGTAIGIDPYSSAEAMEHDHKELQAEINEFAATTDFDQLYRDVESMRASAGLLDSSEFLRMTADAAAPLLAARGTPFGLIHIDGNHDTGAVLSDLEHYLPLLEPGNGFLVLDDISWRSVRPAVDQVSATLTLLYARVDSYNDYAVFWTGGSRRRTARLRAEIAEAAEG